MNTVDDIKNSMAHNNDFFRACKTVREIKPEKLCAFARNWREVTRSFWLSTCRLAGHLAEEQMTELLPPILKIAAEDGGIGGGAVNGRLGPPHYVLWEELCSPLQIDWNTELEPETVALIQSFRTNNSRAGLAMVVVVETIAYEIIEAMTPLFRAGGIEEATAGYLSLHHGLEVEHARDMGEVAELVTLDINDECVRFCALWADFWSAMERVTFR